MSKAKIEFAWEDIPGRHYRNVTLHITEWTYKIFGGCVPSLFQFGGVVSRAECKGLKELTAHGDIEVPPSDLEEPTSDPQGDFHVGDLDDRIETDYFHDPYVGLRLYASPEMKSELFRLFSVAFTSSNARPISLYLHLTLMHPRSAEPNFWRTDWHKGKLYIDYEFGFYVSPTSSEADA